MDDRLNFCQSPVPVAGDMSAVAWRQPRNSALWGALRCRRHLAAGVLGIGMGFLHGAICSLQRQRVTMK
jgi:hypothetical protein